MTNKSRELYFDFARRREQNHWVVGQVGACEIASQPHLAQEMGHLLWQERPVPRLLVKLGDYGRPLTNPPMNRRVERRALARQSRMDKISPEFSQTNWSALRNPLHGIGKDFMSIDGITRENPAWPE